MPNWCWNELSVIGNKSDTNAFLKAVKSKKSPFDFNKVTPTPKELVDTPASYGDKDKKLHEANVKKYGFANWYDFQIANWGTKWNNGDDVQITEYPAPKKGLSHEIVLGFTTAWSPPEPIVIKLGTMFQDLTFELKYDEPGMDFAGVIIVEGLDVFSEDRECGFMNETP